MEYGNQSPYNEYSPKYELLVLKKLAEMLGKHRMCIASFRVKNSVANA